MNYYESKGCMWLSKERKSSRDLILSSIRARPMSSWGPMGLANQPFSTQSWEIRNMWSQQGISIWKERRLLTNQSTNGLRQGSSWPSRILSPSRAFQLKTSFAMPRARLAVRPSESCPFARSCINRWMPLRWIAPMRTVMSTMGFPAVNARKMRFSR